MRETTPLDEDAIVWSHPARERMGRPWVVLLHGYYGHESDWSAWFDQLPEGTVGVSLRGPEPVSDRWAWADFDKPGMTLSRLLADYSRAARGIHEWLDRLDVEQVALVGWSQGGAMAIHLMRQRPDRFSSAALLAGFVANARPHVGVRARRPRVWYAMGGRDDVITPDMVRRSRAWLSEHTAVTFVDLPDEDHMLSASYVGAAMAFTREELRQRGSVRRSE